MKKDAGHVKFYYWNKII